MKVAAEAIKLKAQGVDVSTSARGSRIFPTPQHIGAAAHAAIDANFTKYTTNSGTEELKRAIVRALRDRLRRRYSPREDDHHRRRQAGAVQRRDGLFGSGDEVITHMPGWPTLVEQIKLAEATPVIVQTHAEDGFRSGPSRSSRRSRRARAGSSSTRPATRPAR